MKHLSFFQRCTAFLIDCTVAVFTFNIVAWVISYFYFVPFLPGFFIIWLLYYVISFCFCGQTFGLAFFNGKMVSSAGGSPSWDMLNDSGVLAVFWHMSSVTLHDTGIFVGLNEIKKKYLPEESLGFDKEGIEGVRQKRISQIQSGNYFGIPVIKEYRWIDTYDADRYSLLLESYSSTQTLDEEHKKLYLSEVRDYINSNGGVVEMPQHVMLYLVKKE